MHNFFTLYGKHCLCILFMMSMAIGSFFLFRLIWQQYGIVSDGGKADFAQNTSWGEEPVIDVRSCRFLQYQKMELVSLASARDVNGDDLTSELMFQDAEGNQLSGYLNTETPGIYSLFIYVRSLVTGRESSKNITVLVDGRVSE